VRPARVLELIRVGAGAVAFGTLLDHFGWLVAIPSFVALCALVGATWAVVQRLRGSVD
jgi:uncharacterized membrane protein YdcZ (DUF606 family)